MLQVTYHSWLLFLGDVKHGVHYEYPVVCTSGNSFLDINRHVDGDYLV